jgi:hypothetical protein
VFLPSFHANNNNNKLTTSPSLTIMYNASNIGVVLPRHLICLTVVFLSLCQAFVTSASRFGNNNGSSMRQPFLRGGGATFDTGSSSTTSSSSSSHHHHRLGPLGVLRGVPPFTTTTRSRHDEDDEEDAPASDPAWNKASRSGVALTTTNTNNKQSNGTQNDDVVQQRMPNNNNALRPTNAEAAPRQSSTTTTARAEYVAETKLPTDVGAFQLRGYRIPGVPHGQEPCVIYARDKPPFGTLAQGALAVPVRIHDQCLTSEVFRSQR